MACVSECAYVIHLTADRFVQAVIWKQQMPLLLKYSSKETTAKANSRASDCPHIVRELTLGSVGCIDQR